MHSNLERRSTGITLIETIVALAIAALLTATATPAIGRAIDRARTDGSTRELVLALKAVRQAARTSGAESLFTLDVVTRSYRIAHDRERVLAAPDGATITLLTAESERLAESAGAIRFFPDGSSTGGTITLTHRDRAQHVEIDWLTGHVRAVTP